MVDPPDDEAVDRIGILPRLIEAYLQGSAQDREELRALQKECGSFGGGPRSRGVARPLEHSPPKLKRIRRGGSNLRIPGV